jgi:hypothetical protein
MSFAPAPGGASTFEGWTLVAACASHANVGQLAADLLAHTLGAVRAGALVTPHVLPCCGNDALGDAPRGVLALPIELYALPARRVALLQQRAPAVRGAQRALAQEVAAWAERAGFARVVLLGGLDASLARTPAQMGAAAFRYAAPHGAFVPAPEGGAAPAALGWTALECDELAGVPLAHSRVPPWPLLAALGAAGLRNAVALLLFASEGDNAGHAAALAEHAAALLGLAHNGPWRAPLSWRAAFGASHAEEGHEDIY